MYEIKLTLAELSNIGTSKDIAMGHHYAVKRQLHSEHYFRHYSFDWSCGVAVGRC